MCSPRRSWSESINDSAVDGPPTDEARPAHPCVAGAATSTPRRRVFVGIAVAADIAAELARLARALERFSVRLVPSADLHLTLVPPWNESDIPTAIEKLRHALSGCRGFALSFNHLAYGPTRRQPRMLWAECAVGDEFSALRAALLAAYGQADERPFRPHVTLARIRAGGRALAREVPMDQTICFAQRVESVELFQSPPPGSSGYRVLASLPLEPPAELAAPR